MVRRVVEEDVTTTPGTTVVEDDGSWFGRTIVTLVVLALLVAGAVWLVRALSDDDTGIGDRGDNTQIENNVDEGDDTSTDTDTDTTVPSPLPS